MTPAPRSDALRDLLEAGRDEGVYPSAAAWIATDLEPRGAAYVGEAGPDTLWDVASLTKPMAVVALAMRGVAEGWLNLGEEVTRPEGLRATVRDLLGHRSGLPAWDDLWAHLDEAAPGWRPGTGATKQAVGRRIADLQRTARVEGAVYSDLGYIVLGWHLERRLGASLDRLVPGYRGIHPPSDPSERARYAPTGFCPRRGRRLVGEVNDLNAWILGGVAGHAGIFATAERVGAWALDLARAEAGRPASLDGGVVRAFWDRDARPDGATWVLGWDTPSPGYTSAGSGAGPRAVGHLGFTGTSVWIDRDHDLVAVLLTNRVGGGPHTQAAMKRFRPRFHDAVRALAERWARHP
ncbi:MAG: serine hydrolase domain-containing protein [Myxococcota bacterium]